MGDLEQQKGSLYIAEILTIFDLFQVFLLLMIFYGGRVVPA